MKKIFEENPNFKILQYIFLALINKCFVSCIDATIKFIFSLRPFVGQSVTLRLLFKINLVIFVKISITKKNPVYKSKFCINFLIFSIFFLYNTEHLLFKSIYLLIIVCVLLLMNLYTLGLQRFLAPVRNYQSIK